MTYRNYQQIESDLRTLTPFTGRSMRGGWAGDTFIVVSYSTPIAWYTREYGWDIDTRYYSVTTRRQQNIIKRVAWEMT
jgi:hypothetical protein